MTLLKMGFNQPSVEIKREDGQTKVTVSVPTYDGPVKYVLSVERADDDTWRVFLPDGIDPDGNGPTEGGIDYLGAPE